MTEYGGGIASRYTPYRSRGEWELARMLDQYGLAFIYERPTAVVDRGKTRIWYPDFSLGCGPVIEYFGIMHDNEYDRRTRHKLSVYRDNLIDVIDLYGTDLRGDWRPRVLQRIEGTLENRLSSYRSHVVGSYSRRGHPGSY